MNNKIHYIILKNRILLSKKEYSDWREIQEEYGEEFMTCFWSVVYKDLVEYFEGDFGDESNWPFTQENMNDFLANNELTLQSSK